MGYFRLYNVRYGETIAVIQMDESLVDPKMGIIDPETYRLAVDNGSDYTLHVIADISQERLTNIYKAFQNIDKCTSLAHMLSATDALTHRVQELFKPVEYAVIKTKEDMAALITPNKYPDHEIITEKRYAEIVTDIVCPSGDDDVAKEA